MTDPSAAATLAASNAVHTGPDLREGYNATAVAMTALTAAHDPALGLDRSVCLRDVVEAFRAYGWGLNDPAAFIEREFGRGTPTEQSSAVRGNLGGTES